MTTVSERPVIQRPAAMVDPLAFPWWEVVVTMLTASSVGRALLHVPGQGVLSRQGELVLLCDAAPERGSQVAALLGAVSSVAADLGDGRDLGRRLAGLLATAGPDDDFPALCAFGPAGDGMAVLLHGTAEATAAGPAGNVRLHGRQAVTFVDRMLPGPVTVLRAVVGESSGVLSPDPWSRLDSGVVRAQALVYGVDPSGAPVPQESLAPVECPAPASSPAPSGTAMAVEHSMPAEYSILAERPMAATLVAGPPVTEAAAGNGARPADDSDVLGIYCRNGHFNDPNVPYCTVCGLSMVHMTHELRPGRRPALGVLTLDDGMTFPLEESYVLGRHPYHDELVSAGQSRPLEVDDSTGLVSPVHAHVILDGWDVKVTDANSTYGTYLRSEADSEWRRLPPQVAVPIPPGTWVGFGRRSLRYDSYRKP